MRALIFELRPESLAREGLVAALQKHAASLKARYGLAVELVAEQEPDLPLARKEALYRVAQEALHNITKHAHSTRVELRLTIAGDAVALEVSDDGGGFDPSASFPGHLGLSPCASESSEYVASLRSKARQVAGREFGCYRCKINKGDSAARTSAIQWT